MRYTKKFIEARFQIAAKVMGWDTRPAWYRDENDKLIARVGAVYLEHSPMYGGYDIVQIANEGGAQRQINGWCNRMKASELVAFLDGVVLGASNK